MILESHDFGTFQKGKKLLEESGTHLYLSRCSFYNLSQNQTLPYIYGQILSFQIVAENVIIIGLQPTNTAEDYKLKPSD